MHVYKFVHGSDFSRTGNFNFTKLFMHGNMPWLQNLKGDLNGNENLRQRNNIFKSTLGSEDQRTHMNIYNAIC